MKLDIQIPENNKKEREYIIEVIISKILGIEYSIQFTQTEYYEFNFGENKTLKIKDCFFNEFPKSSSYLNSKNIPDNIHFITNELTVEDKMPIIYGNGEISFSQNQIVTNVDLFSSAFFMLTRWEEYVCTKTDEHNRFDEKESLAVKNNFIYRPVVNEYIEYFWNALIYLGYTGKRKKRDFDLLLTHDVDDLVKWKKMKPYLKEVYKNLKKPKSLIYITKSFLLTLVNKKNDPYNTWDYLMDQSEKIETKSYFYFMTGGTSKYENRYEVNSQMTKNLIAKIYSRKHHIGIHPSYNSYDNSNLFNLEKKRLEDVFDKEKITSGRQHYLRFKVPDTWQMWNDLGMEWESTMTYGKTSGFRCGICYPFAVFNIVTREMLDLIEKPLIFMEQTFIGYQKLPPQEMKETAFNLLKEVKKYDGMFVLLWHNSSFNTPQMLKYKDVYPWILNKYIELKN